VKEIILYQRVKVKSLCLSLYNPTPINIFFLMPQNFRYLVLLLLLISGCSPAAKIDHIDTKVYPLGVQGNTDVDSSVYHTFEPYKTDLDSKMDKVLAYSEQVMEKGQPEGLLGDFVADVSLEMSNRNYHPADHHTIDFCFLNNGGLRAPLPKGDLTKRKIYELMPFENELIVLTLDGSTTSRLLDFIANKGGMPVAGIRFKMKNKAASDISISGKSFDTTRTYKVVTSDYLAYGGDNMSFLADAPLKEPVNLKLRDAIITYLEEKSSLNQTIRVLPDNRISDAK
jgi:2',3'-cyclic-nucleotide 2'-phosphodiesterase (5'-nucleotidase family)